ncbi:MAG: glycosyltransferase family 2 protein [Nanoarchaeota archaeon]|nr:glycosyltransferase family 2 protein [Nanoarchaeota archaeon]
MVNTMNNRIKISVVMPSYNEEKAIKKMVEDIKENTKDFETEIIIVDSSTDKTAEIARQMGVKVISQEPQGHGIALRTAINAAKNDIIVTTDCDYTYPMYYIPKLVKLILNEDYDLISCNRLNKKLNEEMPFVNKMGNNLFASLVRWFYKIKVNDVSTGMFCMKRKVNESIKWENNYSFPCEMIIKTNLAGFKYKEIDISYKVRLGDVTLNKWKSGKAYLKCIFNYKFNLKINPNKL